MASIAGYEKYHIYLGTNEHDVMLFLYINSDNGYTGDLVFENAAFPTIPGNATGESVVSFSMLPRIAAGKLATIPSSLHGHVAQEVIDALMAHCPTVRTLPRSEKAFVVASVAQM